MTDPEYRRAIAIQLLALKRHLPPNDLDWDELRSDGQLSTTASDGSLMISLGERTYYCGDDRTWKYTARADGGFDVEVWKFGELIERKQVWEQRWN